MSGNNNRNQGNRQNQPQGQSQPTNPPAPSPNPTPTPSAPQTGAQTVTQTLTKPCSLPDCDKPGTQTVEVKSGPIKFDAQMCDEHAADLQQVAEKVADPENPYGLCHVCDDPVGVREPDMVKIEGQPLIAKWWVHLDDMKTVCHESCKCKAKDVGKSRAAVEVG